MFRRIMVSLTLWLFSVQVYAQDVPTTPEPMVVCATQDPFHTWQVVDGKCQLLWSFTVAIDIHYPPHLDNYPFARDQVIQYLKGAEEAFIRLSATAIRDPYNPYSMTIDYQLFNYSPTIQTVLFYEQYQTGTTHTEVQLHSMSFDILNNRQIRLEDIFQNTPSALQYIAFAIRKADFEAHPFGKLDAWFFEGTEPTLDNYHAYVLTADALVFYFEPYQTSPYTPSVQSMAIPWSTLRHLVNTEFWR